MLVLLCVLSAVTCLTGHVAASRRGYQQPQFAYAPIPVHDQGPDLFGIHDDYSTRVSILFASDDVIEMEVDDVKIKIDLVSNFREVFENTILPGLQAGIRSRSESLENAKSQLLDLLNLKDEVAALRLEVDDLVQQLVDFRASRVLVKEVEVGQLENLDIVQQRDISVLAELVRTNGGRLRGAATEVTETEQQLEVEYSSLLDVVNIVNNERYEIFEVELTADNPSQSFSYANSFAASPLLTYTITALGAVRESGSGPGFGGGHFSGYGGPVQSGYGPAPSASGYGSQSGYGGGSSGGYGSAPAPVVNQRGDVLDISIDVNGDANGFTVAMNDASVFWQFEYIRLLVSGAFVDNSILQYRGH